MATDFGVGEVGVGRMGHDEGWLRPGRGQGAGWAGAFGCYTGEQHDPYTGLDLFGAREYTGYSGRFLSPDWSAQAEPVPYAKLDDPQSLNLYAYVSNNPLSLTDADGHDPQDDSGLANWLSKQAPAVAQAEEDAERSWSGTVGSLSKAVSKAAGKYTGQGEFSLRNSDDQSALANRLGNDVNAFMGVVIPVIFSDGLLIPELEAAEAGQAAETAASELKYSARVEARSLEEAGPNHNFPRSFDQEIVQNGQKTIGKNGYEQRNLRGSINGKEGTYELGTQNGEVTHRFFRPDNR